MPILSPPGPAAFERAVEDVRFAAADFTSTLVLRDPGRRRGRRRVPREEQAFAETVR
jgi:hypothetical protein